MPTAYHMTLTGANELSVGLKEADQKIDQETYAEVRDAVMQIANEAKMRAPGDTGFLRNQIGYAGPFKSDNGWQGVVSSNADYSAYVEFGTGTKVSVPPDLQEFAIQFKGTHRVPGMLAQPFFFPAAKRIFPIIQERLNKMADGL